VVPATSLSADNDRPDIERGLLDDDDGLLGCQGVTTMTSFSVVWSSGCYDDDVLLGRQGVVSLPNLQEEEDPAALGSICGRQCIVT
jgi:hypothetical protein